MAESQFDFTKPVDPTSRAWCSDCKWKAWGIWSHKKAHDHHQESVHRVNLIIPDTEEEKEARRAEIARLDAEELAEAQAAGFSSIDEARAHAGQTLQERLAEYAAEELRRSRS